MRPSILFLVALASLAALRYGGRRTPSCAEAHAVVLRHCASCHSDHPSIPAFPIAPQGILLDTREQMQAHAERIRIRASVERTMPLLDRTGITDAERSLLSRWVEGGARCP